ncbi:MAG: phosphatidate cytidylyltransferase [Arenicellales bacterium]|nr:phosphatidate cytidylyltransferase [Arenicellales bacterium]
MLKQRIATALVLVSVFLIIILLLPTPAFALTLAVIVVLAAFEWSALAELGRTMQRSAWLVLLGATILAVWWFRDPLLPMVILLGVVWWLTVLLVLWLSPDRSKHPVFRILGGIMVLIPAWSALVYLHQVNISLLLSLFMIVWLADIGAYFAGQRWGAHKLAPLISPGKTIEGVAGGIVMVVLFVVGITLWSGYDALCGILWLGICVATVLFSIVGDLWESKMKRNVDVKDSGSLLPGHGGILDRIDSVTAAAPVFVGLTFALHRHSELCARFAD